jgi:hypothetical protein
VIEGDVAPFVADRKKEAGGNIIKYGNGSLDATLMEYGLIDDGRNRHRPGTDACGRHTVQ